MNALKHGLTTRQMHFASDEEEREFMVLRDRVRAERQPRGIEEEILVEEIASTSHKLRITLSMETKELVQLQKCEPSSQTLYFQAHPANRLMAAAAVWRLGMRTAFGARRFRQGERRDDRREHSEVWAAAFRCHAAALPGRIANGQQRRNSAGNQCGPGKCVVPSYTVSEGSKKRSVSGN